MAKTEKAWEVYERAARKVIADLRAELGVASVEGKQTLAGVSGAEWEVDAKAWVEDGGAFLVIEIRRHTRAGLSQEQVGAVAYRIGDVGAKGGITVAPKRLQKGASLVAARAKVTHLILDPASTTESYVAEFMGKTFHGSSVAESINAQDEVDASVTRRGESET